MNNRKVLIVGIGKLGIPLAQQLKQCGVDVVGIRRHIHNVPDNIDVFALDLSKRETLKIIQKKWDVVIYILAAKTFNVEEYQQVYVNNLNNLLSMIDIANNGRLIFVSSSAVYGQDDGGWIDESSLTKPQNFNGKVMLEAEASALQTNSATVVRFSGIYGSNRTRVIDQVMQKKVASLEPLIYSNRIHETDCVDILEFLTMRALHGQSLDNIYIGSDCEPTPLAKIQRWIAVHLGIDESELIEQSNSNRLAGNKRLSNQRLVDLGYQFTYPNYRLGYREVLNKYNIS